MLNDISYWLANQFYIAIHKKLANQIYTTIHKKLQHPKYSLSMVNVEQKIIKKDVEFIPQTNVVLKRQEYQH